MKLQELIDDLRLVMSNQEIANKVGVHFSIVYRWQNKAVTNITKDNYDKLKELRSDNMSKITYRKKRNKQ